MLENVYQVGTDQLYLPQAPICSQFLSDGFRRFGFQSVQFCSFKVPQKIIFLILFPTSYLIYCKLPREIYLILLHIFLWSFSNAVTHISQCACNSKSDVSAVGVWSHNGLQDLVCCVICIVRELFWTIISECLLLTYTSLKMCVHVFRVIYQKTLGCWFKWKL